MSAAFVLRLFGALRLETGNESYTKFPTKRSALILARLAVSKDTTVGRDELAEQLWPDDFLDLTRLRLRQELRRLRQAIGALDAHIRADRQWVEIEPGCLITDVQMFDDAIASSNSAVDIQSKVDWLTKAVDLLNGPFLAGFQEPWVLAFRRDYEEKARRAWLALAEGLLALGDVDAALRATMNAVRNAPLDVDANTNLIRIYVESGQITQARQAFFDFDALMFRELGRHAPQSVRAVISEVVPELEAEATVAEAMVRGSVPRPTPLHGRSELLESIQAALARPGACVVLVGAVGVGKTHLLKEVAWQFSRVSELPIRFEGTAFPVPDGLFVPDPHLSRTDLLLAIQSAAQNGWRVLAESRSRLGSDEITEVLVGPLPVPAHLDDPADIRANPSVQVLLSKVSEQSNSTPNEKDVRHLAELARRLDGLPSALRVFASRLMIQTPEQVVRTMDDGLVEYAQDLLSSGETVGLAVLLMAAGLPDCTRELFIALALLDGASVDLAASLASPQSPADVWRSLETRCLITVHDEGARRRYRVPYPIAYAIRNMASSDDRAAIESKTWHAVSDWAFEKSRMLVGPHQEYAFNAIQAEMQNIVNGITWGIDSDPKLAANLVVGAWRTVCARGNPADHAALLLRASEVGASHHHYKLEGEAWLGSAIALTISGDLEASERAFLKSIQIFEAAGDVVAMSWANINYAENIVSLKDMRRAIQISKLAADQTTKTDLRSMGLCFYAMGLADMGETAEAVRVGEEVFAARIQTTDLTEHARAYGDLAQLYIKVGRPEAADPLLREGARRLRETGIQDMLLNTLLILAKVGLDSESNRDVITEAGAIASRLGSNSKLLEVARTRMAWTSRHGDSLALIESIEDTFRFTQLSQSVVERERSLRAMAAELDRNEKTEYANAVYAALGDPMDKPVHAGWRALLSSNSHGTICVLAVVMAKEAFAS